MYYIVQVINVICSFMFYAYMYIEVGHDLGLF